MDVAQGLLRQDVLERQAAIRIARRSDRAQIVALINTVAGEHCGLQTDRYHPTATWEALLSEGVNDTQGRVLLVVEQRGRIVGFARLAAEAERCRGTIGIALLSAYRSCGLGRSLLAQLLGWAPALGISMLQADILAENERSLRLFTGSGFQTVDQHSIALSYMPYSVKEISVVARVSQEIHLCHRKRCLSSLDVMSSGS